MTFSINFSDDLSTIIVSGLYNFPPLRFEIKPDKELGFVAKCFYDIWSPDCPAHPQNLTFNDKTKENLFKTIKNFFSEIPFSSFSPEQIFIKESKVQYSLAIYTNGNGKQVSFKDAYELISKYSKV